MNPPKKQKTQHDSSKQEYDTKYEKEKRERKFLPKWAIGRDWLQDTESGMKCTLCKKYENTLKQQGILTSTVFIDGCTSYKSETISLHENSKAHKEASKIQAREQHPEQAEGHQAKKTLHAKEFSKMSILFRNAHALAKYRRPFSDFVWLTNLDEAKGLKVGQTYRNEKACRTFTKYIAQNASEKVLKYANEAKFLSITSDGSTDSSIQEQEIVFLRYVHEGNVEVRFVATKTPRSPDAVGIYNSILDALDGIGVTEDMLKMKLVAFGCDGASVMIGKKGGVATLLKSHIQPELVVVHCLAHKLELAYRDAVKKISLYDSTICLLMGVYYFYHNSPKQRAALEASYEALGLKSRMPSRVGGTRWLGHLLKAIKSFAEGYPAIRSQMEDCVASRVKGESQNKARGFLKLMKRGDVIGYIHLLQDIINPLKRLSGVLQDNNTTLADVSEQLEATMTTIETYKEMNGPCLSAFSEETKDGKYKGTTLTNSIKAQQFGKTRELLASNILAALETRFSSLEEGVAQATEIANFKRWPPHDQKDNIRLFGRADITTVFEHFENVLCHAGITKTDVMTEWTMLKSLLYTRYKEKVQELQWTDIHMIYTRSTKKNTRTLDRYRVFSVRYSLFSVLFQDAQVIL